MTRRKGIVSGVTARIEDVVTSDRTWSCVLIAVVHRDYPGSGGWHSPDDDSETEHSARVWGEWEDGHAVALVSEAWSDGEDALDCIDIESEAEERMDARHHSSPVADVAACVAFVAMFLLMVLL